MPAAAVAATATFVQISIPDLNPMATSLFFGPCARAYTIPPSIGQPAGSERFHIELGTETALAFLHGRIFGRKTGFHFS
jgi:hypothetical protein